MQNLIKLSLILALFTFSSQTFAQKKGDIRIGGGVGLNFGDNNYFGFNISPSVGYMFTNNLEAGVLAGYEYGNDDNFKQNFFNFGAYSNLYFLNNFFARGEYVFYTGNVESKRISSLEGNIDENALWLGGGYRQNIAGTINLFFGAQYNVLYDEDESIFASAWRPYAGVTIGF